MASERVTMKDLERIALTVSAGLPDGFAVAVQGRNGYVGLDLYNETACLDTLEVGTRREVYTYLQGMRRAHLISAAASRNFYGGSES